jgi:hypothetical protein
LDLAKFRASKSRLRGFRIYIAEIKSDHLIPATVEGPLGFSKSTFVEKSLDITKTAMQVLEAEIPVWVPASAKPRDGSSVSIDKYASDGRELWISLAELKDPKYSKLGFECERHDDEWFSCGPIKNSQILDVMPFDGHAAHPDDGSRPGKKVTSLRSTVPYMWSRELRKWVLDVSQKIQKGKQPVTVNDSDEDETRDDDSDIAEASARKRRKRNPTDGQDVN